MSGISLATARTIIEASLAKGRELDLKPLSVVVVDSGGHVKAFEREDGASPGRFDIAYGKANAAAMLAVPTSALAERAKAEPHSALSFSGVLGGKFVALAGGVLIANKDGVILGAVGVTGDTSDNDAKAGAAGVEAAGLVAVP